MADGTIPNQTLFCYAKTHADTLGTCDNVYFATKHPVKTSRLIALTTILSISQTESQSSYLGWFKGARPLSLLADELMACYTSLMASLTGR